MILMPVSGEDELLFMSWVGNSAEKWHNIIKKTIDFLIPIRLYSSGPGEYFYKPKPIEESNDNIIYTVDNIPVFQKAHEEFRAAQQQKATFISIEQTENIDEITSLSPSTTTGSVLIEDNFEEQMETSSMYSEEYAYNPWLWYFTNSYANSSILFRSLAFYAIISSLCL